MKGCKYDGKVMDDSVWGKPAAGRPHDGGSARLSKEGTYKEEIQRLCCENKEVMCCKTKF